MLALELWRSSGAVLPEQCLARSKLALQSSLLLCLFPVLLLLPPVLGLL